MRRMHDDFVSKIIPIVSFAEKRIVEIGSGDGARSVLLAAESGQVIGIEPDKNKVEQARQRAISNAVFYVGSGESVPCDNHLADVVFFTLSFHHVPRENMKKALDEAVRVVKKQGHVIFLEPTEDGSFFEAEVLFDACDGDERAEKKAAYSAMMHYEPLRLVAEIPDEVFFNFDSVEDFNLSMGPKKNVEKVSAFLFEHSFQLRAGRRINIFQVV
jgi:ubiquinone/menaquinone biosynthesis C-methylase UbiE